MTTTVRFAPSPTGRIHIGNARTAILNWLFARKANGTFILRYDDTDLERSTQEFADGIATDLDWLGLSPDKVFRQSERFALYDAAAEKLKADGGSMPVTRQLKSLSTSASANSRAACRRFMTAPG
jgi:glutamyl-tRNA synthetase